MQQDATQLLERGAQYNASAQGAEVEECPRTMIQLGWYNLDFHGRLGYLFTGDSLDRQIDHRIYRLIWV